MLIKDLSSTILCLCLLANVGPDAFVSGRRRARVWDERRSRLGYETDESGTAFADKLGCRICDLCFRGAGRRISLLLFEAACGEKTRDFECRPVFCCIFVVASGQAGEEVPLFPTHLNFI